jgi:cysteine desulfurase
VNVAGIVGFGAAADIAEREMESESKRLTKLRDRLAEGVLNIDQAHLNGHPTLRLPTIANFWFAFIEGESLVAQLDMRNVAASTGSACSSESLEPSHVLIAIGLKHEEAHGSLRLSLGRWTTRQEVDHVVKVLPDAVQGLRVISPFKGRW